MTTVQVPSESQPGFFYTVTGAGTLYPHCDCPAGKHGQSCKHTLPYIGLPEEERMAMPIQAEEQTTAVTVHKPPSMAVQAQQKREILAAGADGWKDAFYLGEGMLASGLLPDTIKNPAAAALVIMTAADLAIPASQAFQYIAIIKQKPMLMARMVQALINRSGKGTISVKKRTATECIGVGQRTGRPPVEVTITMDMAVKAGWTTNALYKTVPANMLYARMVTTIGWMEFADILAGMDVVEGDEYLGYEQAQEVPAYATTATVLDAVNEQAAAREIPGVKSNSGPLQEPPPDDAWIGKVAGFLGDAGLGWDDVSKLLVEPASKRSLRTWLANTPDAKGAPAVVLVALTKELADSLKDDTAAVHEQIDRERTGAATTPLEDALEASLAQVAEGSFTELPPQEPAPEPAQAGFPDDDLPFD